MNTKYLVKISKSTLSHLKHQTLKCVLQSVTPANSSGNVVNISTIRIHFYSQSNNKLPSAKLAGSNKPASNT